MKKEMINNFAIFLKKLESGLFYVFLLTMTLSIRKIVYMREIRASFNEYASVYIYLSDILLILVFFLFILNNKNIVLSNIKKKWQLFHVEQTLQFCKKHLHNCFTWNNIINKNTIVSRGTIYVKKTCTQVIHNYWLFFPLVAVFFSFLSILWTTEWKIGLFRSVKLLEFSLLYFYIIKIVPRGTIENINKLFHVEQFILKMKFLICSTWNKLKKGLSDSIVPRGTIKNNYKNDNILFHVEQYSNVILKCSTWNILKIVIFIGILNSILAIFQFFLQKSAGLFWLKESIIGSNTPGVAKIILNEEVLMRAYGLFPHPNILGGYLVFSIIATLFFLKLFHMEQYNIIKSDCENMNCSTWNNWTRELKLIVTRGTILQIILFVQIIGLFLSFSKSAIFGLFAGLIYVNILGFKLSVPRGTNLNGQNSVKNKLFHVEQFKKISDKKYFLIILIPLFLIVFEFNNLFLKSFNERNFYLNVSRGTILENPMLGVGAGQFIFQVEKIFNVLEWQFQPVHNVYVLIASEFGLIAGILFVLFLLRILQSNCSTWNNLKNSCSKNSFLFYKSRDEQNESTSISIYEQKLIFLHIYLKAVLIAFSFIMLFDHYLWDIQQGSFLLWLVLGLIVSIERFILKNGNQGLIGV